jgi:hypothetical protein
MHIYEYKDDGIFRDIDVFSNVCLCMYIHVCMHIQDGDDNDEYGYGELENGYIDNDNEDLEHEEMSRGDILERGVMLGMYMYIYVFIYIGLSMDDKVRVRSIYECIYKHVFTRKYIYIYIYIYIHTYTYI